MKTDTGRKKGSLSLLLLCLFSLTHAAAGLPQSGNDGGIEKEISYLVYRFGWNFML